jgi:hypothetical protein
MVLREIVGMQSKAGGMVIGGKLRRWLQCGACFDLVSWKLSDDSGAFIRH